MSANPVKDVQARVVAWHNRHPLACRITPEQVRHIGVVALPYLAVDMALGGQPQVSAAKRGSLRERAREPELEPVLEAALEPALGPALDPAHEPALEPSLDAAARVPVVATSSPPASASKPGIWQRLLGKFRGPPRAFSEDFLPEVSTRAIARFGMRFGSALAPSANAGPVRHIVTDAALQPGSPRATATLYVLSAAIEVGTWRSRVLLGTLPGTALLGPRVLSRPRVAACFAALFMTAALGLVWQHGIGGWGLPGGMSGPVFANVSNKAVPAPVTHQLEHTAPQSAPAPAHAAEPVAAPASQPAMEHAPAHAEAADPPAHPQAAVVAQAASAPQLLGMVMPPKNATIGWPVNIRPHLDADTARAARKASIEARGQVMAAAPANKPAVAVGGHGDAANIGRYALVARTTRTRMASEVMLGLMKSAAAGHGAGQNSGQHTEVVPAQEGWRASWWPFTSQQQAQQALAALAKVGLEAELVEF